MQAPRHDRDVSGEAATAALEILKRLQETDRLVIVDLRQDWGHEDPRISAAEDARDYPEFSNDPRGA